MKGDLGVARRPADLDHQAVKIRVGDRFAVDPDPFVHPDEVGGRVEPDRIPRLLQNRREVDRDRTLPVGAGDMQAVQRFFGVAEPQEQVGDAFEPEP